MIFRCLLVFPIFAVDLQNALGQKNIIDMQKCRSIRNCNRHASQYLQNLSAGSDWQVCKLDLSASSDLSASFDYVD